MDQENIAKDSEVLYPILFIPKKCTNLETNCEVTDNVFIDLNITSPDTEGNETIIYSGYCNIKLIDSYDVNIQNLKSPTELCPDYIDDQIPVIIADQNQQAYNQSQVWIDPARSPYVYNRYEAAETQGCYSVCHQTHTSHITVEQHNTYITKNVYNYKEAVHYSPHDDFERRPRKDTVQVQNAASDANAYEEDELQCGLFLSQLPEEIMNEKQIKAREEQKYIGLQSQNDALKQLMSTDIQSVSKQRKTILFLGHDSQCGQTIQQIAYNDPALECSGDPAEVVNEVVIEETDAPGPMPPHKKYQCAKCQQIFDQISAFRDHMINHPSPKQLKYNANPRQTPSVTFMCSDCGKHLKSKEKLEQHALGHGDPDLECNRCHKVFASKFSLRVHRKIHSRKYPCDYCTKTYSKLEEMRLHVSKNHLLFMCDSCDFVASKYSDLSSHQENHERDSSETELADSFFDDVMSERDMVTPTSEGRDWKCDLEDDKSIIKKYEEIRKADSVIAKVIANKIFMTATPRNQRRYSRSCNVCLKRFDRVSDLKRHLIEHIVRSTLAKTPVSRNGTLTIECEVCQTESFSKIDRYKAHLREHAKLTLYKCTFCNKCFSDSSNFSKHKKIHGATYFQCDLCQRKFNTKKMITQHMEYHNQNEPLPCPYCDKIFHFESMLNKHIKSAHTKELTSRFRCRFCHDYFKTLKDKWDHEWAVHNARKMIVDCLICGCKFRKYAELKRHCIDKHDVEIPPAKKLLKAA